MTKYLIAALALAVAAAVLALSFPAGAQLQETSTAGVDPWLAAEIERDGQVKVLISLRDTDYIASVPMAEWTKEKFEAIDWDLRARHAQEVQAIVRAALGPEDGTEVIGFKTMPALGATITASGLEILRDHPDVTSIGAAELGSFSLDQSRPLIFADVAHAAGYDGSGVDVAVLDTGIDTNHPDLMDSIVDQICFPAITACGGPFNPAEDINGHGTRVSGVITSNGTVAPLGIAPGAGIYAYRVSTNVEPNGVAVALALEDIRLRNYPVDFINMSFRLGTTRYAGDCDTAFDQIEFELLALPLNDVLAFAASGNAGDKNAMDFPACNQNVVSVGATYDESYGQHNWPVCTDGTTAADKVACASNSSSTLDLLAPGCRIITTHINGGASGHVCGTSMASPHAAAVAALLRDAQPGLTVAQIQLRMFATGKWVYDSLASRWTKRIDARVAILTDDFADYDGDGCRNGAEYTLNVPPGSVRNPLDSEDYYDVSIPKDGVIDLPNDILGVYLHFAPGGYPPGWENWDRGLRGPYGPEIWNHGPKDGVIDLPNDISSVTAQFNPGGCP